MNGGFTDPASPLVCDLDEVVEAIARLLDESRRAGIPVVYTTVAYTEGDRRTAAAFIDKVPGAADPRGRAAPGSRSTRGSRRGRTSRC